MPFLLKDSKPTKTKKTWPKKKFTKPTTIFSSFPIISSFWLSFFPFPSLSSPRVLLLFHNRYLMSQIIGFWYPLGQKGKFEFLYAQKKNKVCTISLQQFKMWHSETTIEHAKFWYFREYKKYNNWSYETEHIWMIIFTHIHTKIK